MGYGAVLRAVGVFTFPAIVFSVIYYPFAVPAAFVLMHVSNWGLLGYWLPFSLASVFQIVPLVVYLSCTNWTRVVNEQNMESGKCSEFDQRPVLESQHTDATSDSTLYSQCPPRQTCSIESSTAEEHIPLLSSTSDERTHFTEPHALPLEDMSVDPTILKLTPAAEFKNGEQQLSNAAVSHSTLILVGLALLLVNAVALLMRMSRPQLLELRDEESSWSQLMTSSQKQSDFNSVFTSLMPF